jgi:DNA-binding beta-propeller fold protein YncE
MKARAVLACLCLWSSACGSSDPPSKQTVQVVDPYPAEPAFPNKRPRFAMPAGDVAVVANRGGDTLSLIDVAGRSLLGTGIVGRDPVSTDGPFDLAVDRGGGTAYVLLGYPPAPFAQGPHAAQHGAGRGRLGYVQKIALDDMRPLGEVRIEQFPGSLALSDDGKRVVVTHFDLELARTPSPKVDDKRADIMWTRADDIVPAGSREPSVLARACVAPQGIALSPGAGATAYVACYGEDVLAIANLDDPAAPIERIAMSTTPSYPGSPVIGPYGLVRSPSAALLAVHDTQSKDVRIFETAAKRFRDAPIATGGAPYGGAWSADEARLFVPTQSPDALTVIDVATASVVKSAPLASCPKPHQAAFSTDRATLFVTCEGDAQSPSVMVALDPETLETVATVPVGIAPDRLVLAPP